MTTLMMQGDLEMAFYEEEVADLRMVNEPEDDEDDLFDDDDDFDIDDDIDALGDFDDDFDDDDY